MSLALNAPAVASFPRVLVLFLRQRAFLMTLALLLALDLVLVALTGWVEAPGRESRLNLLLRLAPCVIPAVIGTAMWSRGADMETNVPFPLHVPRLLHLASLVAVGIGGSAIVVGSWAGRADFIHHQGMYWLRDSLVAMSLALIASRFIGARFAWVPTMVLVVVVSVEQARNVPPDLAYPWWLWMLRRTDDALSWVITSALVIVAIPVFARSGPRPDDPGEA